jgi:hypothetical protein
MCARFVGPRKSASETRNFKRVVSSFRVGKMQHEGAAQLLAPLERSPRLPPPHTCPPKCTKSEHSKNMFLDNRASHVYATVWATAGSLGYHPTRSGAAAAARFHREPIAHASAAHRGRKRKFVSPNYFVGAINLDCVVTGLWRDFKGKKKGQLKVGR